MEERITLLEQTIAALERAERDVKAARDALAQIDAKLALSKREYDIWHATKDTAGDAE